ncbi:MAG: DivIVA domain-containing protein [Actinomycetia bacterium]|nr:DivIVA domain-containing protein [Actinomycetes bacterium]
MSDLSVWEPGEEPKIPPFPSAFLGYQRKAVDRYIKDLLESNNRGSQVLELAPGAIVPSEHLNRYQDLGREIGELLSAVQQTAIRIREQAELDAANWRGEATIEVQKRIAEAQATAEDLRGAAWEVSTQMIAQIQEMEAEAYRTIRKHSQEVIAEVENQSHRIREDARRRAEGIRSNAHVESLEVEERTRTLCDQMIESAEQQVSAIQERVLALERHRDQLLEEIGGIRSGVAPIGVKLVDQTGGFIYPPTPAEEGPEHVTPQHEMSGLVKVISPVGESEEDSSQDPPEETATEPEAAASEERVEEEPADDAGSPVPHNFDDLFASLRGNSAPAPQQVVQRQDAPRRRVTVKMGEDEAIELQEAMLLPISNQYVRLFKRLLTEEQNRVLEGIRTGQLDWDEGEVDNRLRSHLEMLVDQSWQAGHSAAERMAGRRIPKPGSVLEEEPGFASRLVADVSGAMDLEGADGDVTQKSLMASRMFRVWRSEKLERHLQELSEKYYERGLGESLETAGVSSTD